MQDVKAPEDDYSSERGISVLDTTAAMGVQLASQLEILDKKIEAVFLKISIVAADEDYLDALNAAQSAWITYRDAEAGAAFQEMIGGTGRTVNSFAKSIELTEARLEYLNGFFEEMIGRYG